MKKSCSVCLIVVLFVFLGLKVYAGDSWRSFHNFKSSECNTSTFSYFCSIDTYTNNKPWANVRTEYAARQAKDYYVSIQPKGYQAYYGLPARNGKTAVINFVIESSKIQHRHGVYEK